MEDKYRINIDDTITYYDQNAETFIESTINVDASALYKPFEELLQQGDRILDLGCGSGRDSRYFSQHGYSVIAVDPSQAMCEQTRTFACVPVYRMRAEENHFSNEFDAVWACASLLHIHKEKQEIVLHKIATSLKDGGILYCSWKYGDNMRTTDDTRVFTDMNELLLQDVLKNIDELELLKTWVTCDIRKANCDQKWMNALFKKNNSV